MGTSHRWRVHRPEPSSLLHGTKNQRSEFVLLTLSTNSIVDQVNAQERLLSVTNTFEGSIFVNTSSPLTVPEYVANLFPLFGPEQIAGAVAQYEGLGDTAFQITAIMGECT